jgi:uncharacterized protein YbbC (DUF1343 family)
MIASGLEVLLRERLHLLRGRRVGVVTHPAAVLPDFVGTLDALRASGVRVAAIFGMEHGLSGAAADAEQIADAAEPGTRIPVYSLYGVTREPTAEMLAGLDVVLVDIQDVGARFYTFISTLFYVLRAAGQGGRSVLVLDRPNPVNGVRIEGPLLAPDLVSFVGIAPIPIRHGTTVGELARWFNAEFALDADLTVIPMAGWRRSMWFDETGLPWVPTSPGMPHLSTATVYPGTCLIEGTNLSEGRGTALPFELIGAPWIDGPELASRLNRLGLPGVRVRPAFFTPTAGKHNGQLCGGIQVHVTDRASYRPVATGLHLVAACRAVAPDQFRFLSSSWEGQPPHFDLLTGDARIREGLAAGAAVEELTTDWGEVAAGWEARRQPYLLHKSN